MRLLDAVAQRSAGPFTHAGAGMRLRRRLRAVIATSILLVMCVAMRGALASEAKAAVRDLRVTYEALRAQLEDNQFRRAIHLESHDTARALTGEIYAVLDYPFPTVDAALRGPQAWCDIFTLHFNVKYCHASAADSGAVLTVDLGKKYDQPLADTFRLEFTFKNRSKTPDYLDLEMVAEIGPLSTRDYHLELEAIALDERRSFLHLTYAYSFGVGGRLAMHGYLATIARDKQGFTIAGRRATGEPVYIQGLRGVIERNTMRYCLAIDAYLAALDATPTQRFETRLRAWFDSTERYAVQLHEMDREQYLALKHREMTRQMLAP